VTETRRRLQEVSRTPLGIMNGVKSGMVHWPARAPLKQTVTADGAQGVGEDRTARQLQYGVDALRHQLAHLVGERAAVDQGMVDARGP
jgi:hypothetical protein